MNTRQWEETPLSGASKRACIQSVRIQTLLITNDPMPVVSLSEVVMDSSYQPLWPVTLVEDPS